MEERPDERNPEIREILQHPGTSANKHQRESKTGLPLATSVHDVSHGKHAFVKLEMDSAHTCATAPDAGSGAVIALILLFMMAPHMADLLWRRHDPVH
jgi:hypothetical protein